MRLVAPGLPATRRLPHRYLTTLLRRPYIQDMTKAQQAALETLKANGGVVWHWGGLDWKTPAGVAVKVHGRTLQSLEKAGLVVRSTANRDGIGAAAFTVVES